MIGITIRKSVSREDIETDVGTFDISRLPGEKLSEFNKRRDRASSVLINELAKFGYFQKEAVR